MALENFIPRSYDPARAVLTLGGVLPYGYAPDTMITIAKSEHMTTPQQGILGSVVLSKTHNTLGTLTISLQQVSPFNQVLSGFNYTNKTINEAYSGFFPVGFYDPNSGLGLACSGWIQTQPDYANAQESGTLEWVIGLHDATLFPTAAPTSPPILASTVV